MLGSRSRWARWTLGTGVAALAALVLAGANAISAPVAASTYIVQLDEPPLALYGGGIAGLAPTMPAARGTTRLAPASPASVAYLAHLASRQNAVKSTIDASIGRSAAVSFRYRAAFNGLALSATPSEAAQIATLPGVRRVQRDETRQLLTDSGPAWIGAGGIHDGTATGGAPGTKGEGIVVGIIDTGINHDHPSFADVGGDGFNHTNPRTVHFGVCAPLNPVLCNDKLIGMYDFTGTTPFDDNLHGSHTASTVAGNIVDAALVAPTLTYDRRISGVAPHANVIAYKACNSLPAPAGGCVVSATVAAIDQATFDQVDVVNFSIGGASRNPWTDPNALAFLGANAAGVFVAASAGNSGPGATTIGSPADSPWLMSVGASTHDRNLPSQLTDMVGGAVAPPATITGKSVAAGAGPAPIVYAGAPPHNAPLCGAGAADPVTGASASNPFPPGSLAGMIVVCDRGTYGRVAKGSNVKAAGGIGMVLANDAPNGDSLIADLHVLPAVHISFANGQVLKTWLASGTGHTARITGMVEDKSAANGDVMASFSSRGPNPSVPGVVKPDVTAPGVDVYAAFNTPLTAVPPTAPEYGIISGTSMSSPHAAGAAALLRALKPNWTPNQLKSAFMTTGFTTAPGHLKEDATRAADPFDMGGGRVELRRAARVGLVLDVDPLAFQGADPGLGGDPRRLNLASMANENCQGTCSWTRTVTSVASGSVSWTASTTAPAGASLSVSPASFTLAPGQSQTLTVTATNDGLPANAWRFGAVTLAPASPGVPAARLPVALRAAGVGVETCDIPDATVVTDASGDQIPPGFSGAYDIESLSVSGLYPKLGESANPNIRWKLKVASLAGELPRNTTWRITWTAGTPARTWFVHMNTFQPTGVAFQYGEITTTASTLGAADDGSFAPDGTIKITIAASKVGGTEVGQTLTAVNARTATLVGAAGTGLTVNDDTTANGTYTLRTCAAPPAGPDAVDDTAATTQGEPVTIAVLANDTHPQGEGLTVSAVTQPATGVAALNLDGTITYSPADEFSGSDTFTYTVSDSQGLTDTASVTVTVAPLCPTGSFADDMESGAPGWTTQTEVNEAGEASATWAVTNDLGATSPSNSWFSDATTLLLKDDRLVMPAQELTSSSRLIFWHRFRFEPGFDGGVLEVSTDGGGTWQDILDAGGSFLQGGYDGTIDPDFGSPIAGRAAWTGGFVDAVTAPMTQVSVDVGALAGGGDVLFRFRLVTDPFGVGALPGNGWWIDDVEVSETALSCNEPPTSVDDGASVDQGNSVEIDVLANDSDPDGDPLTIESFTDGTDGTVAVSEGGLVYTHDGSSTEPDSFTYTVSDGRGGTDSATVSIAVHSPAETLESVDAELEVLIEGDRGRSDKLEDVRAKLQTALAELRKSPPSAQAALGAIEGAVGELEAAVASGYLDGEQGTSFLERVTGAGRQLAMQAIDAATARGGDAGKIDEAGRILADGDALRAGGSYKEAVNKYKDALAKAEGAGP